MNPDNELIQKIEELRKEIERLKEELEDQKLRVKKLEEGLPSPLYPPVPPPPPPYEKAPEVPLPKKIINLETIMSGNWLVKVGIAAIIIGIGFFLKYAIDRWGMGPTGRVIAGLAAGIILITLGEYLKDRYRKYSQALTGGGIAILYLSIFAAFNLYQLIDLAPAFAFMIIVTLTAGVLSLRYDALPIAFIGIVGGFFTPFMLGVKNIAANQNIIFAYIVLLNLGILAISSFKNWRLLSFSGFLFTYLSFGAWFAALYKPEKLAYTEFVLTIFFLLFSFITIFYHFIQKRKAEWPDLALMTMNAAIYFSWSYGILVKDYRNWMGFFAVILAFFYCILAYLTYLRKLKDPNLTLFLAGISLVFLTIAIPIQLKQYWITIAWAAEAVVLSWLGFYLKSYHLRAFSLLLFLLVIIRLLGFDMAWEERIEEFTPIFNKRFFAFFVSILAFYLASYIWWLGQKEIKVEEKFVLPFLLLSANFLSLWILSNEIIRYFDGKIAELRKPKEISIYDYERCLRYYRRGYFPQECVRIDFEKIKNLQFLRNLSISLLWGLYAIILSLVGILKKYKPIQLAGLILIGLIMGKLVFYDVPGKDLTLAQNFYLSFIWSVYSIIIICLGIFLKYPPIRVLGLTFLWLMVFKVFLYDTWRLAELYRIGSYITLGIILLITGYLYLRFRHKIKEFLLEP